MARHLPLGLLGALLLAIPGGALAHHSFAMFDADNPVVLAGTVTAFKFTSPHAFIMLKVVATDGSDAAVWSLEGVSASSLVRDGWSSKTLKAGDEIKAKVTPLRSGAPGGAWAAKDTSFMDGKPIVVSH
jgi:hypothetical protein